MTPTTEEIFNQTIVSATTTQDKEMSGITITEYYQNDTRIAVKHEILSTIKYYI